MERVKTMKNIMNYIRHRIPLFVESDSSKILRTIRSNKIPGSLSQLLDTTLKDSHDLRVFGLGTLSTMSSIERYTRFTYSMYGIYSTMEDELDQSISPAVQHFWCKHKAILRRTNRLVKDLEDVGVFISDVDVASDMNDGGDEQQDEKEQEQEERKRQKQLQPQVQKSPRPSTLLTFSDATKEYMDCIRDAGESDRKNTSSGGGGGRLLGHAYTRYLADLMGGSVLAQPTKIALNLSSLPQHYSFSYHPIMCETRKEYVEHIYSDLNESGKILLLSSTSNQQQSIDSYLNKHKKQQEKEEQQLKKQLYGHPKDPNDAKEDMNAGILLLNDVVDETRKAFHHNINVYSEEPIVYDAMIGIWNLLYGYSVFFLQQKKLKSQNTNQTLLGDPPNHNKKNHKGLEFQKKCTFVHKKANIYTKYR